MSRKTKILTLACCPFYWYIPDINRSWTTLDCDASIIIQVFEVMEMPMSQTRCKDYDVRRWCEMHLWQLCRPVDLHSTSLWMYAHQKRFRHAEWRSVSFCEIFVFSLGKCSIAVLQVAIRQSTPPASLPTVSSFGIISIQKYAEHRSTNHDLGWQI